MTRVHRDDTFLDIVNDLNRRVTNVERNKHFDDDAIPDAPTNKPNVTFKVRENKTHLEYQTLVDGFVWGPTQCKADVNYYIVELEGCHASGTAQAQAEIRRRIVHNTDSPGKAIYDVTPHPENWYYHSRYATVDKDHRESPMGPWSDPVKPSITADPKPPTPTGLAWSFDRLHKTRWHRIRGILTWDEVGPFDYPGPDNDDHENDVRGYGIEVQHSSDGGTTWVTPGRHFTKDAKDADNDTTKTLVIERVNKRYVYRARVRSWDRFGRRGDWSSFTAAADPTDTDVPPAPTNLDVDVNPHTLHATWDAPTDAKDSGATGTSNDDRQDDVDIAFFQVQVTDDTSFANILFRDRYVAGHEKTWRLKKPGNKQYRVRVRSVSASGVRSAWQSTGQQGVGQPPSPGNVRITGFDLVATGRNPTMRLFAAADAVVWDQTDIGSYQFMLQTDDNSSFNHPHVERRTVQLPKSGDSLDPIEETFGGIHRGKHCRVRARAIDDQGRQSEWSGWTADNRAFSATRTPNAPTGVTQSPNVGGIDAEWNSPADPDDANLPHESVDYYQAQVTEAAGFGRASQDFPNWDGVTTNVKTPRFLRANDVVILVASGTTAVGAGELPSGFTLIGRESGGFGMSFFYHRVTDPASEPGNYACGDGSNVRQWWAFSVSGAKTTGNPVVAFGTQSGGSGTTLTMPNVTNATDDLLVIRLAFGSTLGITYSNPTNATEEADSTGSVAAGGGGAIWVGSGFLGSGGGSSGTNAITASGTVTSWAGATLLFLPAGIAETDNYVRAEKKIYRTRKYNSNFVIRIRPVDSVGNIGAWVSPSSYPHKPGKVKISAGSEPDLDFTATDGTELGNDMGFYGLGVDIPVFYYLLNSSDAVNINNASWKTYDCLAGAGTYSFYADRNALVYAWGFVQCKNTSAANIQIRFRIEVVDPSNTVTGGDQTSIFLPNDSNFYQVTNMRKYRASDKGKYTLRWSLQTNDATNRSITFNDRKLLAIVSYSPKLSPEFTQDVATIASYEAVG